VTVIDADAHVIETERTWEYIDAESARPVLVAPADRPNDQHWLVDGKLRRRAMLLRGPQATASVVRGRRTRNTQTPEEAREMANLELRLQHMDQLGIDIQVLHNTLFIEAVADREETDAAVCRSWNRWLGDIWERGGGRFRWSCVVPLSNLNRAVDEIRYAKEHGAVAVCLRPIEGNRTLPEPYFYPVYEEALAQDLAIAVHIANGNSTVCDVLRSPYDQGSGFALFRAMTAVACHSYILSDIPRQFPDLRWGFIEASAQWIPWVAHEAASRSTARAAKDVFKDLPIYVTCQTDDDLPYVLEYAGEDCLVIGTDYGHFDPSSEIDAISILKGREDISHQVLDKILDANPRRLYGL
jgi:predicted TIM-barrel fold metal-dependent hydrolase